MEVAKDPDRDVKPFQLKTQRLVLRPLTPDDAPGMYAIYSDPETMRYWSAQVIGSLEGAANMVRDDLRLQLDGHAAFWAIVLPKTGRVIGKFTLFTINRDNRRAEIGYVLNRQFWGKGYGTECLAAMLEVAFDQFQLHRLEADIDPENTASLALLKKFGFREEGKLRERWLMGTEWRDSVMMALLAPAWRLARAR
ncbi:MAG: GNAT family N-acetyltransferase [Xanthomonadales bacterium]|jgi:RimJ/RimL family protein N-acetyltransferase|nr:GNAT family N-acetyltransferase [Xanthomonadales bacterium]